MRSKVNVGCIGQTVVTWAIGKTLDIKYIYTKIHKNINLMFLSVVYTRMVFNSIELKDVIIVYSQI